MAFDKTELLSHAAETLQVTITMGGEAVHKLLELARGSSPTYSCASYSSDTLTDLASEHNEILPLSEHSQKLVSCKGNIEPWFLDKLKQCRQENWTKEVVREVPNKILTSGNLKVSITDVSIKSRGPDEVMYERHSMLRNYITRGLSLIRIEDLSSNSDTIVDCVVYANKKFCGSTVEDDDGDSSSGETSQSSNDTDYVNKYFLSSPSSASRVIAMEKINGEAAHFSARCINGQFYLIAGSKNVHLMFQTREHIELYTEDRYLVAREVAFTLLEQWNNMTLHDQIFLQHLLHFTRTTVVCEIMMPSHQHIVNFGNLSRNKLVVVSLTTPPQQDPCSLTALPSETTLGLFKTFGFDVPDYESLSLCDVSEHMLKTRQKKNSEGIVYYYEDIDGNTTGLVKLKSCWYIHLRALRQQASYRHTAKKTMTLQQSQERARARMLELQHWLHTTDEDLELWQSLADQWLEHLEDQVQSGAVSIADIRNNFPLVWEPFFTQINESPRYTALLKS